MHTLTYQEASSISRRVVSWCLGVAEGERSALITDTRSDPLLVDALLAELQAIGPCLRLQLPFSRATPHGYLLWTEPEDRVAAIIQQSDVAIVYMSNLICLSKAVAQARAHGTRLLFLPGSYDFARPLIHEEDWGAVDSLGQSICSRLVPGARIAITSAGGTSLTMTLSAKAPFWDDARALRPGELDFFPGGMWNSIPDIRTIQGKVVFEGHLHPLGILTQPVEADYDDGVLKGIRGGRQAREWERWLKSYGDDRVFEFSHLSGGLASCAAVLGHDWEDLIIRGSILISGGENVLYGGDNKARAHFDGVVLEASMSVNDEWILKDGTYLVG